jgi:hypothetical protein
MPMDPKDYPKSWPKISWEVRARAAGRCECTGECEDGKGGFDRCPSLNGGQCLTSKGKVVLTVHHLNGNKRDNRRRNLKAMCQACHLAADRWLRKRKAEGRPACS